VAMLNQNAKEKDENIELLNMPDIVLNKKEHD
jgi:hypothetical protein